MTSSSMLVSNALALSLTLMGKRSMICTTLARLISLDVSSYKTSFLVGIQPTLLRSPLLIPCLQLLAMEFPVVLSWFPRRSKTSCAGWVAVSKTSSFLKDKT